ncbi:uncharacterized protein LOC135847622 [Planococcus citri]|uniref:uncharacterized protein LOC135847622 n=1 Tax=Planococcus citri TaxID=170843 RepID=UPI0031F82EF9
MAIKITSDVYDILTPVPLEELSAIVISREIWRCEVMKYRSSDEPFYKWDPIRQRIKEISLETVLPDLRSVIYDVIRKYVKEFGYSLSHWLQSHHERVFHFHYNHENHVLKHFLDFICNYRGSIHYARTAERMMHCDQFNVQQKFMIACTYFFEDDIRRLWPLVSGDMDLNGISFSKHPQLYYWICCLRNELDKIPIFRMNDTVDEVMLNKFMAHNRPSIEYFWNRISSENRKRNAVKLLERGDDMHSFIRVILPKLDEQELDEFINERSYDLMRALCRDLWCDEESILEIWMQICHTVNERAFTKLVRKILRAEVGTDPIVCEEDRLRDWSYLGCEMWNNAPDKFKRAAVREIISNDTLFNISFFVGRRRLRFKRKEFRFLRTVLSRASSQDKRTFWYDYWRNLIYKAYAKDFRKIMNLCLENEDEIIEFAKNVLVKNKHFRKVCIYHMEDEKFAELDDFLSIAWPENFKKTLAVFFYRARTARKKKNPVLSKIKRFVRNMWITIMPQLPELSRFSVFMIIMLSFLFQIFVHVFIVYFAQPKKLYYCSHFFFRVLTFLDFLVFQLLWLTRERENTVRQELSWISGPADHLLLE